MLVKLDVDVSELERKITRNPEKRIAYAVVNAINATAKTIQLALQHLASDTLTLRKPGFILRNIAILKPFASVSQGRPYAEIAVGQKSRLLLSTLVTGGLREPFTRGAKSVAVPVDARPSRSSPVTEALQISKLRFKRPKATTIETRRARRKGLTGKTWEGEQGTYLIPGKGIFQRVAGAASRVLYVFARPFRLRALLPWYRTVDAIARRVFAANLRAEIQKALQFNRGR